MDKMSSGKEHLERVLQEDRLAEGTRAGRFRPWLFGYDFDASMAPVATFRWQSVLGSRSSGRLLTLAPLQGLVVLDEPTAAYLGQK